MSANDLEVLGDDPEHDSEEDLLFDSIMSSSFAEGFPPPSIGPN